MEKKVILFRRMCVCVRAHADFWYCTPWFFMIIGFSVIAEWIFFSSSIP